MKKTLILVLAVMLVATICVMVACSTTYVNITYDQTDAIATLCDENDMNSQTTLSGESGFSTTLGVVMANYYDPDTLKVYANGEQIAFTKSQSYDANVQSLEESQIVGTISFEKVTEDIKVTFECEEKEITIAFQQNTEYQATPSTILRNFRLDDNVTLYDAVTNADYTYKTTFSQYSGKLSLTGAKNGYYKFYKEDDTRPLFTNANMGDEPTVERNKYSLQPNEALVLNNTLIVNVDAIAVNTMGFNSESGSIVKFSYTDGLLPASNIAQMSFTLDDTYQSVDISNTKVYVNDTLVTLGSNGQFTFPNGKLPVDYLANDNLDDVTKYDDFVVRVEGVDMSEVTTADLIKVTVDTPVAIDFGNSSYYKQGNIAWYEKGMGVPCSISFDTAEVPSGFGYVYTIKQGDKTHTIDITDYAIGKLGNGELVVIEDFVTVTLSSIINSDMVESMENVGSLTVDFGYIMPDAQHDITIDFQ